MEVRAWGDDSGTAPLATAGDTGVPRSQGHQEEVPTPGANHGCDLLCPMPCVAQGSWALPVLWVPVAEWDWDPLVFNPTFLLSQESPGPVLGTGTLTVPPSLPLTPFMALEDPPPAQEPPAQNKPPLR